MQGLGKSCQAGDSIGFCLQEDCGQTVCLRNHREAGMESASEAVEAGQRPGAGRVSPAAIAKKLASPGRVLEEISDPKLNPGIAGPVFAPLVARMVSEHHHHPTAVAVPLPSLLLGWRSWG